MQIIAALNHLGVKHFLIGLENNLPRKPPKSNLPILQDLVPDLEASTLACEAVPSLEKIIVVDNASGRVDPGVLKSALLYQEVVGDGEDGRITPRHLAPDDVVNIQFTSGTTSMPKAASLSHWSILNNGKSIGDRMLLTPADVICCAPPLFHCFGLTIGYMASVTRGSCIVFPAESFSPEATLRAVQENACTVLHGVPTMFLSMLDLLSSGVVPRTGLDQLRTGVAAGSSIPQTLMTRLHQELNLTQLTICYGMTETSPVSCMTTTDDPMEKRLGTVGRCLPNVDVKVVDPLDVRRTKNVGEKGELATAGYPLMAGYWGDEAKTREAMVRDEEGRVWMLVSAAPHLREPH